MIGSDEIAGGVPFGPIHEQHGVRASGDDFALASALGLNWTPSKREGAEEEPVTEDRIISVLKEHQAGIPTAELCRKHGISDATFYRAQPLWRDGDVGCPAAEEP